MSVVTLFTGRPGAGKTAQLVAEIVRLQEAEPGRPLFAMGINGLKEGVAAALTEEQLHKWWELPPGSIIAIDECQEPHLMPRDRGTPAEWVQRIAKVRHFGMSFLLTTQDPGNMSSFVRRLVTRHVHTVRKFGTEVIQRYEWERCIDSPDSRSEKRQAVETVGTLPKKVFDLYKSSQLHTIKRRLPKKVYFFVGLVVVAIGALIAVPFVIRHAQHADTALIAGGKPGAPSAASQLTADQLLRQRSYAKWMAPRVPGLPWTAPAFDHLQVKADPHVYCIAVADGRCKCVTEQGTDYDVSLKVCRSIARSGLYDPFQAPVERADERRGERSGRDQAQPPARSATPPTVVGVSGPHPHRATASAYVPPEFGPWNPEAL